MYKFKLRGELLTLAFVLAAAGFIGHEQGYFLLGLALGFLIYIFWHFMQFKNFIDWLETGEDKLNIPMSSLWAQQLAYCKEINKNTELAKETNKILENRFKELSAAMPDGAVVLNDNLQIQWGNSTSESLLGLKLEQDSGEPIQNFIRDPEFIEYISKRDTSTAFEFSSPIDSSKTLRCFLVPYGSDQLLLTIRDISKSHMLETIRKDFVANVSHELRTPLTVLSGYLEAFSDNKKHKEVSEMRTQTHRMETIINDLLTLSELESARADEKEKEKVSFKDMAKELQKDAYQLTTEDRHPIKLEGGKDICTYGVRHELYSAFSNILSNSIRYSPEGGEIIIAWGEGPAANDTIYFSIQDNGIGMEHQHLSRLTERFYRIDASRSRSSGGTGLGLAIVKHILQRHDAELRFDSITDVGTQVFCVFKAQSQEKPT
ncbi:MAG: phosphate regulon sensor histidine kinase PhoR [Pseudomonadota bacterium]